MKDKKKKKQTNITITPEVHQTTGDSVRTTVTLPGEMQEKITAIAKGGTPELSFNQILVFLLDYALKSESPKIRWILERLPEEEKKHGPDDKKGSK